MDLYRDFMDFSKPPQHNDKIIVRGGTTQGRIKVEKVEDDNPRKRTFHGHKGYDGEHMRRNCQELKEVRTRRDRSV